MVQLTRIYTRGGDKGKTSLGSGDRVYKSDIRIHAIGETDEANSFVGWARQFLKGKEEKLLARIQNDLFDLGADLCMPDNNSSGLRITGGQVEYIENMIDEYNGNLEPLNSFVLPGGSPASGALHMARAIVRRAERSLVSLHKKQPVNPEVIKYMNRLSDLLFVLCRHENDKGKRDILWVPGANR